MFSEKHKEITVEIIKSNNFQTVIKISDQISSYFRRKLNFSRRHFEDLSEVNIL